MSEQQAVAAPVKPIANMRITFWGVQGSCPIFPTPGGIEEYSRRLATDTLRRAVDDLQRRGNSQFTVEDLLGGPATPANIEKYQQRLGLPERPFYGGETTCIEVETSEGNRLLFDAGTGIRRASLQIVRQWSQRTNPTLHLFGSHEHLDHRSGLTFAAFCYAGDNPYTVNVYGSFQFLHALDQHYGLFSQKVSDMTYVDDPVDYSMMAARFVGTELSCPQTVAPAGQRHWQSRPLSQSIAIGATQITAFPVYHVSTCCLAYKVVHNGKSFVFCTDHELRHGPDAADPRQQRSQAAEAVLRQHLAGADVAYMDGQYYLEEYLGLKGIGSSPAVKRIDWGHGCIEDIMDRAVACRIGRTYVGHHDPDRDWPERAEMDDQFLSMSKGAAVQIHLADSDAVIDL